MEQQGRFSLAIDVFKDCLEFSNEPIINENLARCLCSAGEYEKSVQVYRSILENGDAYTYIGYGLALYFFGDYADSLSTLEKAIEMSDANGDIAILNDVYLNLAQVLYALGTDEHHELCKQQLFQW